MNQFESLCKLASDETWCWDLSCTTCGHMHFQYAFLELIKGRSPTDELLSNVVYGLLKRRPVFDRQFV